MNDIDELKGKYDRAHAELLKIHSIVQCIGDADFREQEDDTVTVRGVKNLVWLLRQAEKGHAALQVIAQDKIAYGHMGYGQPTSVALIAQKALAG